MTFPRDAFGTFVTPLGNTVSKAEAERIAALMEDTARIKANGAVPPTKREVVKTGIEQLRKLKQSL